MNEEGIYLIGDMIDRKFKVWPRDSLKQITDVEINLIEYESLQYLQCLSNF